MAGDILMMASFNEPDVNDNQFHIIVAKNREKGQLCKCGQIILTQYTTCYMEGEINQLNRYLKRNERTMCLKCRNLL